MRIFRTLHEWLFSLSLSVSYTDLSIAYVLTLPADSGQVCTASTRLYVEKERASEFTQLLVEGVRKLKQGDPSHDSTNMGPQADSAQTDKVSRFLDIGKREGKVLVGGAAAIDIGVNYIEPTIFTDVQEVGEINQNEIFGPVLVLHEFVGEDEAIESANNSECK